MIQFVSAVDSEVTSWGGVIVTPGSKAYEKEEKPEGEGDNMDSEESAETTGETTGDASAADTSTTEANATEKDAEEKMETTAS